MTTPNEAPDFEASMERLDRIVRCGDLGQSCRQSLVQFRHLTDLVGGGREQPAQTSNIIKIISQDQFSCFGQRLTGRFRRHKGVAVAVTADPGAEANRCR